MQPLAPSLLPQMFSLALYESPAHLLVHDSQHVFLCISVRIVSTYFVSCTIMHATHLNYGVALLSAGACTWRSVSAASTRALEKATATKITNKKFTHIDGSWLSPRVEHACLSTTHLLPGCAQWMAFFGRSPPSQVQYSLLYRAPETNGVLEACRESGTTLVAYSPLCQGLLTGEMRKLLGLCLGWGLLFG